MKRLLIAALPLLWLIVGCQGDDNLSPNLAPETSLANVPVANTPENPYLAVLTLSWDGGDSDGYVVGYEYKWTTHHLIQGDSLVNDWQFITKAESTFAFESSDSVNLQAFLVRARDNDGAVDPTPASLSFYTARVMAPETYILAPDSGSTLFILSTETDSWRGIVFSYSGDDPDGDVAAYSWQIDERDWSDWTDINAVTLVKGDFPEPVVGPHTFKVRARDNTLVEDPTPAEIQFYLVEPSFAKNLLVVDETKDGTGSTENPTDEEVDDFYAAALGGHSYDSWDYASEGPPPVELLGEYRLVLWHSDDSSPDLAEDPSSLAAYLDIGGKLIMGGKKILRTMAGNTSGAFVQGDFAMDYLHIKEFDHEGGTMWVGGDGTGDWEWATVRPDTAKLRSNRRGNLNEVDAFDPSTVFAHPILLFNHFREDSTYHSRPCALFYDGTTYDAAYFGFPLYYTQADQTRDLLDDLIRRMGE